MFLVEYAEELQRYNRRKKRRGVYMSQVNTTSAMKTQHVVKEIHFLAIFTTITSFVFWAFFAWSKNQSISELNPFAVDPYDAIGSFAFQLAIALSILSLARSFQQIKDANSLHRLPFILRGIGIALFAIFITIVGDGIAVAQQAALVFSSTAGGYLMFGLGVVAFFAIIDGFLYIRVILHVHHIPETSDASSSLGEALNDLYLMILSPVLRIFPQIKSFDRWLRNKAGRFAWLSPSVHPWRFVMSIGIVLGLLFPVAEFFKEGPPDHLQIAFLVIAIFLLGEMGAILLGFLIFGGFLGLRPPLFWKNSPGDH